MKESFPKSNNNENKQACDIDKEELTHSEYDRREKAAIKRTKSFFDRHQDQIEPTAEGAIKLHIYNFLFKNPDASKEELKATFKKINKLSETEKEYSHENNFLPTIGIELEVPLKDLTYEDISVLNQLKIHNESAEDEFGLLWEVNPSFSYSPSVQSRIIQELAEMNAIPLKFDKRKRNPHLKRVSEKTEDILSLHINFGIPIKTTRQQLERGFLVPSFLVNDLLNYAFTSPKRITNRKTSTSLRFVHDAEDSEKNKNFTNLRLELRASEFRDYPTYRLIAESQKIIALFIAHMKFNLGDREMNDKEKLLAQLWGGFRRRCPISIQRC